MLGRVLAGLVKEEAREHRLLLLRRERKTNPGSEIKMRVRSHNGGDMARKIVIKKNAVLCSGTAN